MSINVIFFAFCFQAVSILHFDDHWQQLSEMLEFSEMMLETWLQLGLQLYLIYYYYGVRLASLSQRLSLYKSIFILVPLSIKALMPADTFTKNPLETWIIAIKIMVWITFLWLAMLLTSIYIPALCIGNSEEPLCIWILSSSVFISVFFIIMSFRKSGYGRLKCYMLCVLFLQFGIYWTITIIVNIGRFLAVQYDFSWNSGKRNVNFFKINAIKTPFKDLFNVHEALVSPFELLK